MVSHQPQCKHKIIPHEITGKPWEIVGTDIFTLNNSHILCMADYNNKFSIVKRAEGISAE